MRMPRSSPSPSPSTSAPTPCRSTQAGLYQLDEVDLLRRPRPDRQPVRPSGAKRILPPSCPSRSSGTSSSTAGPNKPAFDFGRARASRPRHRRPARPSPRRLADQGREGGARPRTPTGRPAPRQGLEQVPAMADALRRHPLRREAVQQRARPPQAVACSRPTRHPNMRLRPASTGCRPVAVARPEHTRSPSAPSQRVRPQAGELATAAAAWQMDIVRELGSPRASGSLRRPGKDRPYLVSTVELDSEALAPAGASAARPSTPTPSAAQPNMASYAAGVELHLLDRVGHLGVDLESDVST